MAFMLEDSQSECEHDDSNMNPDLDIEDKSIKVT